MVDYHLPDLYGDLECDATADQAEIKKQYRKLALRHHPDRNPGKESEFATKFQAIQLASHVLGDPALRASYDAKRNQQNSRANAHFSFPSFKTENPSKKPDAAHAFKKSAESENQVDKNGRISTSCATAEDEKTYFPSQDLENLSSWKGKKRDSKRYDSELNVAEHVHPRATSARLNRKHRNSAPKEEAHSLAEADAAGFQEREALPRAMQEEMEKNRLRKLGAQTPSLSKTPPAITMPFALKSEEKRSDVSQSLQHKTRDNTLTSSNSSSSRNNVEAKRQISPIENCVRPSQVVQSVQKDAPNIINELAKKAASRIFELQNPMDHIREEIESNISAFPKNLHNAAFAVHWNLNKYIEQELKQNQNLAHILTVSGSAKSAYSTTCADYVNMLWPDTGPWMLETLQIVIDRGSYQAEMATDATGVIAVDACNELDGSMTIKISSSRSILVNIAQQLAWLAAISRISFIEELTYSHVQFRHLRANEFEITVLGDRKLCKGDEMCWHPLFANTVIAYGFPVPPRNGEMGIEIPFDIMLRLARITYAVTYDDGLVLSGFSTLLFPSAYHQPKSQTAPQSHTVQWHLVTGTDDHTRISAGAELAQYDHLWLKIKDEELLRSARTFLGHCRIACVRLGTENSGFSDVSESSLADDKPNPAISVRSGSIGTSGMGILGATMNVEAVLPRGLARMTKIDYYNDILWTAKSMPIILYDANQQQAWLVPTLSVILHMVHAWVATHAPDIQLPYAKPDWNGGQAAWDIIAKFSRLELQRSLENDTPYFLKDLVKRLWEHLVSCFDSLTLDTRRSRGMIKTGHPKLRGWEYMDIVNPPVRSKMKEQVLDRSGCGWEILTEDVLLLVCKGLGEVIQPAQPGSLCAELYPMQRGSKYLTASVACLRHLSQKRGMGVTCTKLADHVFWPPPTPNLFDDCSHGTERPCHKALQQLVEKECRESTTAVPAEAAVLFGHRTTKLKKKVPKSLVKKSSKMMANGSLVECTNQCVVNASLHSAECYSQPLSQGESTVSSTQPAQSEGIPGFSSLALANERYTGLSTQETTDQNTPRKSVQSIPKTTDELIQKPRSHAWRRELFG